jgi:iron-sulfur cluster protein
MSFAAAAREQLADTQLRANLRRATATIRDKRAAAVAELPDWEQLRDAGAAIKDEALARLPERLEQLEAAVSAAGGRVHWARDGAEANAIVAAVAREHGIETVAKVKSIATDEIGLREALAASGVEAVETDLAELIVQLGGDTPSHILVPAIHRNRAEIREIFAARIGYESGSDDPAELAEFARLHLRRFFLEARMAVSGANFAVAETGAVCVVESEGNGRMCTTLPEVLVTVMGIEKLLSRWSDLGVMLQLLPRSATGERMNPYTSLWTGVREGDGPREFHLVLLDNGRTATLADPTGREALRCIRCSACLNVCPVYSRTGGHAYESVYPGPIGAILTPQLREMRSGTDLPSASTLCGACYEVCPVKIEIPKLLLHLRGRAVAEGHAARGEVAAMKAAASVLGDRRRYELAQRAARVATGRGKGSRPIRRLPPPFSGWTDSRDLPRPAAQTFREWWRESGRPRPEGPRPSRPARPPRRRSSRPAAAARSPFGAAAGAREAVLATIRSALAGDRPSPEPSPRGFRRESPGGEDRTTLFLERLADYTAGVRAVDAGEVAAAVEEICRAHGAERIAAPAGLDAGWRPEGVTVVEDGGLSVADLDAVDGVLSGCAGAIAETGTILLDGGPESGRRALTLLPDLHVCVVRASRLAGGVPEGIEALREAAAAGQPITLVSGPSATSDIELERVEGVHGPRRLEVVLVRD